MGLSLPASRCYRERDEPCSWRGLFFGEKGLLHFFFLTMGCPDEEKTVLWLLGWILLKSLVTSRGGRQREWLYRGLSLPVAVLGVSNKAPFLQRGLAAPRFTDISCLPAAINPIFKGNT